MEFVEKSEAGKYANVLLFGPPKTGKTTGAASAPGLIGYLNTEQPNSTEYAHMQDTEGRIKELLVPKDPKPLLSEVMRSCYPQTGEGFDTWVLDTVGELHRRLLVHRSKGAVRPTLDAYGDVAREVEDFCRFMVHAPCNFVIVAHEQPVKDETSGGFKTLPFTGTSNPSLAQKLLGMVDIIGFTGAVQVATEDDQRETLYVSQLTPTEGRPVGVRGRFNALLTPEGYRITNLTEWFAAGEATPESAPEEADAPAEPQPEEEPETKTTPRRKTKAAA
jgi:hypothetical protein